MEEMREENWVLYSPVGPLKLHAVLPLLEYLYALPQEVKKDQLLTREEDESACSLLLCLPLPLGRPELISLVEFYADPAYRISRTLHVWRGIARSVARRIQDGD